MLDCSLTSFLPEIDTPIVLQTPNLKHCSHHPHIHQFKVFIKFLDQFNTLL